MTTRSTPITASITMGMIILPVVLTRRKNSPDQHTGKMKFFQVPLSLVRFLGWWDRSSQGSRGPAVCSGSGPGAGTAEGRFPPLSLCEVFMICFLP